MATVPNLALAVGRRKTAVARVYLRKGSGNITVNGRKVEDYFPITEQRSQLMSPLATVNAIGSYDLLVRVNGGGINGQVGAIVHGLARVLCEVDVQNRASLKPKGFLARDSRMVERKKYGRKGARRSFQFSKR